MQADRLVVVGLLAAIVAGGCSASKAAAPQSVLAWVRSDGVALPVAPEAFSPATEAALLRTFGDAQIIGLGEATHGTHEFFDIKHRLIEFAVQRLGFTVVALEADDGVCHELNAYVHNRNANLDSALRQTFPFWNTVELRAMLLMLRQWNAQAAAAQQVSIVGIDMQSPIFAYRELAAFARSVALELVDVMAPLGVFEGDISSLQASDWKQAQATMTKVAVLLRDNAAQWQPPSYAAALHNVRLLQQAAEVYCTSDEDAPEDDARDKFMAENLQWQRRQVGGAAKTLIWAHNGHVALLDEGTQKLGTYLRADHAAPYVSVGFDFGHGSYLVIDPTHNPPELVENRVANSVANAFALAFPATTPLLLDLRRAPADDVAAWLRAPHQRRHIGGLVMAPTDTFVLRSITEEFDVVIFVPMTTATKPTEHQSGR